MRIAVIADTHDKFPEAIAPELASADEIWHLGDVCQPEVLSQINHLGPPVVIVRGNNDWTMEWPLVQSLERHDFRFLLVHIPPRGAPRGCDAVLHGHTHVPRDEVIDGIRYLNPGCLTRPNRGAPPSYAILEIASGALDWHLRVLPRAASRRR